MAGKVSAVLAESNDSFTAGFMTCHLWADCLETGISSNSGPDCPITYGTVFTCCLWRDDCGKIRKGQNNNNIIIVICKAHNVSSKAESEAPAVARWAALVGYAKRTVLRRRLKVSAVRESLVSRGKSFQTVGAR